MTARRASITVGLVLIVFAALIALTIVGIWKLGTWMGFFLVYQWVFNQTTNYGVDANLARIAAILIGAAVWFGAIYAWRNNRKWSIVIILGLLVLQSGFLYFANIGRYFSPKTGEATRYFTVHPITREIQLFDTPIFDAFGQKAERVTSEIAQRLERERLSDKVPNSEVQPEKIKNFFDPYTGEALVYYYQDMTEEYHLYLRNGYDSKTGAQLLPITQDVVKKILPVSPIEVIRDFGSDRPVVVVAVNEAGYIRKGYKAWYYGFGEWAGSQNRVGQMKGGWAVKDDDPGWFTARALAESKILKILPTQDKELWPGYNDLVEVPTDGRVILFAVRPAGDITLYTKSPSGEISTRNIIPTSYRNGYDNVPTTPQPTSNTPTSGSSTQPTLPDPSSVQDSQEIVLPVSGEKDGREILYGYEYRRGFAFRDLGFNLVDDSEGRRHIKEMILHYWCSEPLKIAKVIVMDQEMEYELKYTPGVLTVSGERFHAVILDLKLDTWAGDYLDIDVYFKPADGITRCARWTLGAYEQRAWGAQVD